MTTPFPFVAAQVLTAAELNAITNLPSSTKTVSYVLVAGDAGKRIVMNAAGATTITANTSLFSAGDVVELSNIGGGVCTVTAGTATVSSAGPLAIPQYGGGRLVFTSASAAIYFPSAVTVAAPAAAGLTFIAKTNLTAATQHNLTNVFSSSYDHYHVRFSDLNCGAISMRCGTSGTPDTSSNYSSTGVYFDVNQRSVTANAFNASSSFLVGNVSTQMGAFMEISSPFLTVETVYAVTNGSLGGSSIIGNLVVGSINTATSYTDLVLIASSGNISGTISIYGLANS